VTRKRGKRRHGEGGGKGKDGGETAEREKKGRGDKVLESSKIWVGGHHGQTRDETGAGDGKSDFTL